MNRQNFLAIGLILVFILLAYIKNLAFWSPSQTFLFADTAINAMHIASLAANVETLFDAKDSIVFWNSSYLAGGVPGLLEPLNGILYPPNWPVAALAAFLGDPMLTFPFYTVSLFIHLAVASFFTYKLLRDHWSLEFFPALFGGLLWIGIGFNAEYLSASSVLKAGIYLPVSMHFLLTWRETNKLRYFFLHFISIAFSFLVGYPMVSLIITGFSFLVNIFFPHNELSVGKRFIWYLGGFFSVTLPIIAPLYFTTAYGFAQTTRTSLNLDGFLANPATFLNIIESFIPKNTPLNLMHKNNYVYLYISFVAVMVLLQSKFSLFRERRNLVLLLLGVGAFILAIGKTSIISEIMYFFMPGFNLFRRLSVFSLISGFVLCIFAAQAVTSTLERKELSRPTLFVAQALFVLLLIAQIFHIASIDTKLLLNTQLLSAHISLPIILCVILFISFHAAQYNKKLGMWLLAFALLIEIGTTASSKISTNSTIDPKKIFTPGILISKLKDRLNPGERVDLLRTQYNYNTGYLHIDQTSGYLGLATDYGAKITEYLNDPNKNSQILYDVIGVKYILTPDILGSEKGVVKVEEVRQDIKHPEFFVFNYESTRWEPAPDNIPYFIYENRDTQKRIFLSSDIKPHEQKSDILLSLGSATATTAFIDPKDFKPISVDTTGSVAIEEYKRNYIRAAVATSKEGFVEHSSAFFPGWKVKVNGEDSEVVRTNWFMMGTYVPPGRNIVEFYYVPYGIYFGLAYLGIAILGWIVAGIYLSRKVKLF